MPNMKCHIENIRLGQLGQLLGDVRQSIGDGRLVLFHVEQLEDLWEILAANSNLASPVAILMPETFTFTGELAIVQFSGVE